ncbi:putative metalloprotease CJM1_0395 family protein [Roseibium sp. SCP14]|uniref:putative metalloprotease CJM1_0395 family protein n=1 Tax=Roseibium sp. SCP14 TaxID=3141375 RepID=UPI003338B825
MIGALLSNTPANLLRGSGVAGETEPGAGETSSAREGTSARESLASPRNSARQASNVPVLTPQAVLALQEADQSETSKGRSAASGAEAQSDNDNAEDAGSEQKPASGVAGGGGGQSAAAAQSAQEGGSDQEEDSDGDGLNEAEEKQVKELAKRDREVRAHEQAHARVGGAYASAPTYTFQQGPDGKRYAIGGEVQIDTAKERTPEATIRKMQIVIRAATAPAEPSSQDLKVAQQARSQLSEAQAELRQQKARELKGEDENSAVPASPEAGGKPVDDGSEAQAKNGEAEEGASTSSSASSEEGKSDESLKRSNAIAAYREAANSEGDAESLLNTLVA